jgi:hypothetical protein
MGPTQIERNRRYRRTPRGAYARHREGATRRGIAFELTFAQWWAVWSLSGYWSDRGPRPGNYVMCRRGDIGPYALGNVFIGRFEDNLRDARVKSKVVRRHTARSTSVMFV